MDQKINLLHPAGKKAIRMDMNKYTVMEKSILTALKASEELTHSELLKKVTADFKKNNTKFEGSVEWHMEWVKLDLEAKKKIRRSTENTPVRFAIIK